MEPGTDEWHTEIQIDKSTEKAQICTDRDRQMKTIIECLSSDTGFRMTHRLTDK